MCSSQLQYVGLIMRQEHPARFVLTLKRFYFASPVNTDIANSPSVEFREWRYYHLGRIVFTISISLVCLKPKFRMRINSKYRRDT